MIIECPYCEAKVDGEIIGEIENHGKYQFFPFKAVFLKCPVCQNGLLGGSDDIGLGPGTQDDWSDLTRLWPQQETDVNREIPAIARNSLVEAEKCYKATAYSMCATAAGKTLEGVCKHYKTKKTLANGLKELKDKGIIDDRIYQWSEELRKHRNIGAHATEEDIKKEDAKDLLDFAQAICDYVFVLNAKFNRFMERKDKEK